MNMSSRKDSIIKMRDLLVMRRDALRKALAGDLSLLKQLREQTGGDVVDAALDAAQDEISSQLAEVESRELAILEGTAALARFQDNPQFSWQTKALAAFQRALALSEAITHGLPRRNPYCAMHCNCWRASMVPSILMWP